MFKKLSKRKFKKAVKKYIDSRPLTRIEINYISRIWGFAQSPRSVKSINENLKLMPKELREGVAKYGIRYLH